jgi:signal transduction histidine kinase
MDSHTGSLSMTAPEDRDMQRQFRYLEWAAIALTAGTQFFWCQAAVYFDSFMAASFLMLLLSFVVAVLTPRKTSWRLTHLICQILLLSAAGALGAHHFYYLNFYVLSAKAALLLPRTEMLLVSAVVIISHVVSGQYAIYALHNVHIAHHPPPRYYRSLVLEVQANLYFLIGLITVIYLGRTLVAERKNRSNEQSLGNEVDRMAIRSERARIARNIHDGLGHTLNSLKIQLELALKLLEEQNSDKARELLMKCREAAGSSLSEVRRAVTMQHNVDFDLRREIMELVDQINEQGALTFTVGVDYIGLTPVLQNHIFKMVQECLTNVRKHSSATHVDITLKKENGQVILRVSDNGAGFDGKKKHAGFGLKGLRERAKIIGAYIAIDSELGKGTKILVSFPTTTSLIFKQSPNSQSE